MESGNITEYIVVHIKFCAFSQDCFPSIFNSQNGLPKNLWPDKFTSSGIIK